MRMSHKVAVTKDERLSAEFPLSIMLGHGLLADPVPPGMKGADADEWRAEQKIMATRRHEAGQRFAALYARLFGRPSAQSMDLGYTTPMNAEDVKPEAKDDAPPLSPEAARVKSLATYEALREGVMKADADGKGLLGFVMKYGVTLERDWYINEVIAGNANSPRHTARAKAVRAGLDALMKASVPGIRDDDDAAYVVELRRQKHLDAISMGPKTMRGRGSAPVDPDTGLALAA